MRYRRILLISPEYNHPYTGGMYPNGGLLSIGTVLKEAGHEVRLVHMTADKIDMVHMAHIIGDWRPDLVGISVMTFQTKAAKAVARIVKLVNDQTPVIVGGPHPSALGSEALHDFLHADIAVLGEGEETMKEIAEGRDWNKVRGICLRGVLTEPRPRIEGLDSLPLPDLSLVSLKNFSSPVPPGPYPSMSIMASRGCPMKCTFCSRAVFGNTVRFKSPERVVEEIEWLHRNWGIREIYLHDDTFNLKREWTTEIFELIIRKRLDKLSYKAPFRADEKLVDRELLRLAKRAGMWLIFYGVESGNQEMLDRMHKGLRLEEIKRAFRLTHKAGIKTTASFIVGYPGETEETIKQSLALAKELKPFWVGFSRLTPFPGTEVERLVRSDGYLLEKDCDRYRPDRVLARTEELSAEEIEQWAQKLDRWAYRAKIRHLLANPAMAYRVIKGRR